MKTYDKNKKRIIGFFEGHPIYGTDNDLDKFYKSIFKKAMKIIKKL